MGDPGRLITQCVSGASVRGLETSRAEALGGQTPRAHRHHPRDRNSTSPPQTQRGARRLVFGIRRFASTEKRDSVSAEGEVPCLQQRESYPHLRGVPNRGSRLVPTRQGRRIPGPAPHTVQVRRDGGRLHSAPPRAGCRAVAAALPSALGDVASPCCSHALRLVGGAPAGCPDSKMYSLLLRL